ncbi:hypothetical protein SCALM49S_06729 [Streptomyces californicus]
MGRGTLRIYLGAAPGVGKTYAMLSEAHRRVERGTDCVVALVEHHDRPRTEVLLHGLEQVRRSEISYRSAVFTEMDVDAVLERAPAVALVDELAHTNVPGSRNAKRWQDVEELLKAGIDVISTVNIQHLESLGDVVESITGVRQRETVPDEVVRRADQIELVDMSPQALRRRIRRTATSTSPTRWTPPSRTTFPPRQPHRPARAGTALGRETVAVVNERPRQPSRAAGGAPTAGATRRGPANGSSRT